MILIKNRQKKIPIDIDDLKTVTQKMLDSLGYHDFDIGILLTRNTTIREYNRTYRNKNEPTDILSFPYHPELKPGEKITVINPEDKNLGDIIISVEYARKKAAFWKQTFEEHLHALIAHGIAHLLNYDHQTDAEFEKMQAIEKQLLKSISR